MKPVFNLAITHLEDCGSFRDFVLKVLEYSNETGVFTWIETRNGRTKKGAIAGSIDRDGYVRIRLAGRAYLAHRLAWLVSSGKEPRHEIDHINGVRDDNRMSNLREANDALNAQNKHVAAFSSASGVLGVREQRKGKFIASIKHQGKNIYLGTFPDVFGAKEAYLKARRSLFQGNTL